MPDINMQVFEEAKRSQLVTEVDIQTQVALDDYQVQLSDIANPTQSQDNVVIDRHGEFLPHWNESLDFDTWIKMSMEFAGKKLLIIHGNTGLNSESSIDDTMIFGDDFKGTSLDSSKWNDQYCTVGVSDGELTLSSFSDPSTRYRGGIGSIISTFLYPIILETRLKSVNADTASALQIANEDDIQSGTIDASRLHIEYTNKIYAYNKNDGAAALEDGGAYAQGNYYNHKLIWQSSESAVYLDGILKATETVNTPNEAGSIQIRGDDLHSPTLNIDWIFARQYIAVEPTTTIGIPKNISTVLKSLGRAG